MSGSEQALVTARASVMIYDDVNKKWIPSGVTQGLSKVQIYHHTSNNTFRVVGRKVQDHEVVINCAVLKGLKYNKATDTFHQWRDNRQVYGLNFPNKDEANNFAQAMETSLETLNMYHPPAPAPAPPPPAQVIYQQPMQSAQQQNGPHDHGDSGHAPEYHNQQRKSGPGYKDPSTLRNLGNTPQPLTNWDNERPNIPQAPAAPAPPQAGPPAPPAPPPPPPGMGAPPAGPPPPPSQPPPSMARSDSPPPNQSSLALALQGAKLKKVAKPVEAEAPGLGRVEGDTSSGGSGGSGGASNSNTLNRQFRPAADDMMSEMQKKLAQRRAKAEEPDTGASSVPPAPDIKRNWDKNTSNAATNGGAKYNGAESPKGNRRKASMGGPEVTALINGSVGSNDLDSFKQDILTEMRKEMQRMKQEIIEAVRHELSHR